MTTRLIISTIILTLLLANCSEYQPEVSFDGPFPKRKKNLTRKLGDKFFIKKSNDTISYRLTFNPADKNNYIINDKTCDTIFAGTVSKYRGLYLFDHQLNDTTYWISAVDIDKDVFNSYNTIRGLGTTFQQMNLLYKRIKNGEFNKLLTRKSQDNNFRLRPDRKILFDFYTSIIDSFPPDTLVDLIPIEYKAETMPDTTDQTGNTETNADFEEFEIIENVYPNPTKDYLNIVTDKTYQYRFDLVDNNGKMIYNGSLTSNTEQIDLTEFQTGIYVLRVYTLDKQDIEMIKIIKKE